MFIFYLIVALIQTLLPVLATVLNFNTRDKAIINRQYWSTGQSIPFPKDSKVSEVNR